MVTKPKIENLVALVYTEDWHSVAVKEIEFHDMDGIGTLYHGWVKGEKLYVDANKGEWSLTHVGPFKVGRGRPDLEYRTAVHAGILVKYPVIGVYDRTNTTHLSSMVRDAIKAVDPTAHYTE